LLALLQGQENAVKFGDHLQGLLKAYQPENLSAMYVPLDSHDTERFMTLVGGNTDKLKLAFLFQMAFPGAPAIYYGDEIGLEGSKDPDSRRAFPWKETGWNLELRAWVKTLISLRKRTPSLRRGEFIQIFAEDGQYAFARTIGEDKVLVVLNATSRLRKVEIPCSRLGWGDGRVVQNLINNEKTTINAGKISLNISPWNGAWIG